MSGTVPMSTGQLKDLSASLTQSIPTDLPAHIAQRWIGDKASLRERLRELLFSWEDPERSTFSFEVDYSVKYPDQLFEAGGYNDKGHYTLNYITLEEGSGVQKFVGSLLRFPPGTPIDEVERTIATTEPEDGWRGANAREGFAFTTKYPDEQLMHRILIKLSETNRYDSAISFYRRRKVRTVYPYYWRHTVQAEDRFLIVRPE
jgi:hypothetical protein